MLKIYFLIFFIGFQTILLGQSKSTKRGIAYGHHSEVDLAKISTGISWWYNWYHEPESAVADVYKKYNIDYVPMAWGKTFDEASLRTYYSKHPEAKYLLGFNEPNFTTQSNLSPKEVALLWPKLEKIASDFQLKIVGPAVNYCDQCVSIDGVVTSDPIKYLDTFFAACPNCQVDYIAVHNYMCYAGALSNYIESFKKYNKPIWLTEFACWDQANITLDMQKSLMLGAIDYLESEPSIFRYSWFHGDRSGAYPYINLFTSSEGKLSELGNLYLNYNPIHKTDEYTNIPARIEAESYSAMTGIALEATKDVDGIANVGWIDAGDWMDFNVNVTNQDNYYIYLRLASNSNTSLEILDNNNLVKTVQIANSGGWQNWKTIQTNISLNAGQHKIKIKAPSGGFNLNWIHFADHALSSPIANAGDDKTIKSSLNSSKLEAITTNLNSADLSYQWTLIAGPSTVEIANANESTTNISGLQIGVYTFLLSVSTAIEKVSDQININVSDPTGLESTFDQSFKIYPNPIMDFLNIEFQNKLPKSKLIIVDQIGRICLEKEIDEGTQLTKIDLNFYMPGVYFIKLANKNKTICKKIIK